MIDFDRIDKDIQTYENLNKLKGKAFDKQVILSAFLGDIEPINIEGFKEQNLLFPEYNHFLVYAGGGTTKGTVFYTVQCDKYDKIVDVSSEFEKTYVNHKLYEKCEKELEDYKEKLLKEKTPEELLERSYEIATKEELICCLSPYGNNMTLGELNKLNNLDDPLETLYNNWQKADVTINDLMFEEIQYYAKKRIGGSRNSEQKIKTDDLSR